MHMWFLHNESWRLHVAQMKVKACKSLFHKSQIFITSMLRGKTTVLFRGLELNLLIFK